MFDVAIFTDSTPEESLHGQGGFQFQSASPGITPTHEHAIMAAGLIHVVDPTWVRQPDPLTHPPSCHYRVIGDASYLSRGQSTGDTYTGRPGNQLTQTLVSSDGVDFVPYRPAQVFGAARWTIQKAGSKLLDAWATPLEIDGEFEVAELKRTLLTDSWAHRSFAAYLTMVEQSLGQPVKKLVIVGDDLGTVMKWIALGTLFLEPEVARSVTFSALVKDWLPANVNIVATDPVFGTAPSIAPGTPYNIFDLIKRDHSPIEASSSAVQQSEWFLNLDPDDALAAVSLARSWEPVVGPSAATYASQIVYLGGSADKVADRDTALEVLAQASASDISDDIVMYADELLSAATGAPLTDGGSAERAAEAGWRLLDSEAADHGVQFLEWSTECFQRQPQLVVPWSHTSVSAVLPADRTPPGSTAHSRVTQVLVRLLSIAPTDALADTFTIAGIIGVQVPPGQVATAINRFADLCVRNPDLLDQSRDYAFGREIRSATFADLIKLLAADNAQATADVIEGRWDWAAPSGGALACWLAAAALGRRSPDDRLSLLHAARGGDYPPEAWGLILSGVVLPKNAQLVADWIKYSGQIGPEMGQWLSDNIEDGLRLPPAEAAQYRPISAALVTLCQARRPILDPKMEQLANDISWLHTARLDAYKSIDSQRNSALRDFAKYLNDLGPLFIPEIGELLIEASDAQGVRDLTSSADTIAVPAMVHHLRRLFEGRDSGHRRYAFTQAMDLLADGTGKQKRSAAEFLTGVADSREGRSTVDSFRRKLDPKILEEWDEFSAQKKKGRMTRNLVRGSKRLLGKED